MKLLIAIITATLAATLAVSGSAHAQAVVTEAAIHAAVTDFVRDNLEGVDPTEERFEINTRWQGDVQLIGEGEADILLKRISSQPFRGPTVVRAELRIGGQTLRVLTLTVDTRIFRGVLVTTRTVRRGETFSEDMVEYRERDVTSEENGYFTDFSELEGLQASRTMGFDRLVTPGYAEAIPVVFRGGDVTLILETNFLRLSTRGTALQDGSIGERIRVKNQDTGKLLRGEVVDAATVRIHL